MVQIHPRAPFHWDFDSIEEFLSFVTAIKEIEATYLAYEASYKGMTITIEHFTQALKLLGIAAYQDGM